MSDDHPARLKNETPSRLFRNSAPGLVLVTIAVSLACTKPTPESHAPLKKEAEVPEPTVLAETEEPKMVLDGFGWAERTASPEPGSSPDPNLSDLTEACGKGDMGLHAVAEEFARHGFGEPTMPDLDLLSFLLRKRGVAIVMPEVWVAEIGAETPESELVGPFRDWTSQAKARGEFWCGVGQSTDESVRRVVALRADVPAYFAPLPTRIEDDERPEVRLRFIAEVNGAELVLLSPEGGARHVPLTVRDSVAIGKLPLLSRGVWTVQVMARASDGPRPVAGALVSVGQAPPEGPRDAKIPGEEAFDAELAPADAVFALLNGARRALGLGPLKRNPTLDRIAAAHSARMLAEGRIGHTSGDGTPEERVRDSGITPNAVGENVALAPTPQRLHRALWASPSHRENLLLTRWDEVGVAVAVRADGALFLTQLFIDKR